MEHITRSIRMHRIVLTCEVCQQQQTINTTASVAIIGQQTDDFYQQHKHQGSCDVETTLPRAS